MNHQHEGMGGSYVVGEDGNVNLVERTLQPGEAPPEDPPPAEATQSKKAAKAAFSSSAASADQPEKE